VGNATHGVMATGLSRILGSVAAALEFAQLCKSQNHNRESRFKSGPPVRTFERKHNEPPSPNRNPRLDPERKE